MKKILVMIVMVLLSTTMFGQKDSVSVKFSGDIGYYTKNLSTFTGLMFGENPSVVTHVNVGADYKKFNISAAYSGQHSIHHLEDGDRFNMLDLSIGYKLNNEISACVGYELTYSDNLEDDEIGHGIFGIATWSNKKLTGNFIFFADPKIQNTYYIGSLDLQVMKNVSIYLLGGYTNTKSSPYGLIGVNYSTGMVTIGAYCALDKDNPGPLVRVVFPF